MVSLVGDLKTPLSFISANLQKHGVLVGDHGNCDICKTNLDKCEELKGCVQELMNQGSYSLQELESWKKFLSLNQSRLCTKRRTLRLQ